MKKGVFPYFGEGLQTVSAADDNWDGVSGFVDISSNRKITFDVGNYNDPKNDKPVIESGQSILITCTGTGGTVDIAGGVRGAGAPTTATLAIEESVTVMYHEDYGFLFIGGAEISIG